MGTIKKIPKKDLDDLITNVANAYPGMKIVSDEDRKRFKEPICLTAF